MNTSHKKTEDKEPKKVETPEVKEEGVEGETAPQESNTERQGQARTTAL